MMDAAWRRPTEKDYARIVSVVDAWWGGRPMANLLPRLFVEHFTDTSHVVDGPDGELLGFVIAFISPTHPDTTYIHFVGVNPDQRVRGLGRLLYERVAAEARAAGCTRLAAVTSPLNEVSQSFHRAMGFAVSPVLADYDGPGQDRVLLTRHLT
jgi:L-amino acid N-acyltransferase YncA